MLSTNNNIKDRYVVHQWTFTENKQIKNIIISFPEPLFVQN